MSILTDPVGERARTSSYTFAYVRSGDPLARPLLQLPGVLGVRVKIAKLEIFDDCEVAIRVETGQW